MKFTKLHDGISCDCLDGSHKDTKTPFLRRIMTSKPALSDFNSYHEIGKKSQNTCEKICSNRGVSIYKCSDDTKEFIIKKQSNTIKERKKISPMAVMPEFGYFFTLKDNAGFLKQTGSDGNHHDLYKCDDFTLDCIVSIEVINLADV